MVHNPEDLRMSFCTEQGVKIEIYDTFCKNFTQKDKEIVDAKINDLLDRAELRRLMADKAAEGAGAPP